MTILSWILFGLIAGAIAKALHPGKDPGGWIITIIIGIAGALLGGWISTLLGTPVTENWRFKGFLFAVVGSVILLWLYAMLTRKRT
ncbi:hypothetical protein PIECOFPK_02686 [Mycovorax composti]|uniref:GlsB/YeaQ/YmgE family stress response membrane protein n=1 Tax=Mycovorax composti TaxID=2962693 RepID=A0ABZ2ENB6_9BACT